jgi:hypothetical protein
MTDTTDDGVPVTRCPPGKAFGADDLRTWAHQRAKGGSGVPTLRKAERAWRKQYLKRQRRRAARASRTAP